jgi:hypothetical protein
MRGRWLIAGMVMAGVVAAGGPAAAGGSWLEPDRPSYAPGDPGMAGGVFGDGSYEGTVEDGPFFLYMVPGYRYLPRNGSIPDWAELLGPLTIKRATGKYCCWVASAAFTVPDVPPGRYTLDYCNEPCTLDGIGDLVGGTFMVADTTREAKLSAKVDQLREDLLRSRQEAERLEEVKGKLAERNEDLTDAESRIRRLTVELAGARAESEARDGTPIPWPAISLALAASTVALAAFVVARRRRHGSAVPDFVPESLLRDTAGVRRERTRAQLTRGRR